MLNYNLYRYHIDVTADYQKVKKITFKYLKMLLNITMQFNEILIASEYLFRFSFQCLSHINKDKFWVGTPLPPPPPLAVNRTVNSVGHFSYLRLEWVTSNVEMTTLSGRQWGYLSSLPPPHHASTPQGQMQRGNIALTNEFKIG